jgi:2-keto-4-pentenoate hydratase/2-oxohepta-3-ene-1,7-dioic acid hydratase in catechol pathway
MHSAQRAPCPLNMFMKNPDAVIGSGDTIQQEAELALVMKGPAKMVKSENWRDAVFGYTCFIDVTARGAGRRTWPASQPMSWLGKSFDTFAPLGPCIVTADGDRKSQRPARAVLKRRPAAAQLQHRRHGASRARAG